MGRESNFSKGFSMTCGCIAAVAFVFVVVPILFFAGVFSIQKVGQDAIELQEKGQRTKPTQQVKPTQADK